LGDFHEIWYAGDANEDDLDATFFNLIASAIPKWRTSKLLRWAQRNPLITFEPIGGFGNQQHTFPWRRTPHIKDFTAC
jgi:hypothetical protein